MVPNVCVIWIRNPKTGWHLISIKHPESCICTNSQISQEFVVRFDSILDEVGVALNVVGYIFDYLEVVTSMNCNGTIVGVVNRVSLDYAL